MTCLLLIARHPPHHADLVFDDLLDVLLVVVQVLLVASQPCVLTVELLLDDVVPLLQTLYQHLVVGDEELDVLPILARLLFETVALQNAFFKLSLIAQGLKNTYPLSFILVHRPQSHHHCRRMPHRPGCRHHWHVKTLPLIQDP